MNEWELKYLAGDTPWNKGAASPGLLDLLAEQPITGRVLVPGCGFGYDVRAIATTADEVLGVDIATSAVEGAQEFPRTGAESYETADLFALPEHFQGAFDAVWEHTCFCAIEKAQRPAYVEAVASVLRPGGKLFAMFYLDPGNTTPDEGPPFGVSIAELDELFLPRFELEREWLPERAYPGREGREWMRVMQLRI